MSDVWLVMKRGLYYRPDDCGYTGIRYQHFNDSGGEGMIDRALAVNLSAIAKREAANGNERVAEVLRITSDAVKDGAAVISRLTARAEAAEAERAALDISHKALGKQLAEMGVERDKLREALDQAIDDMGPDDEAGLCVCLQTKNMMRAALGSQQTTKETVK